MKNIKIEFYSLDQLENLKNDEIFLFNYYTAINNALVKENYEQCQRLLERKKKLENAGIKPAKFYRYK